MVNGQRLKVYYEPDVVPLHHIHHGRRARTSSLGRKTRCGFFVNSFFIFLEFLAKIYWANFFSWAKNAKKGWHMGNRARPTPGTGWAGRHGPTDPVGPRWRFAQFFPRMLLFDFLLSENLKGSLNKENVVSRVFLFGLFICRIGT
jgi:hypothetical protein